MRNHYVLCTLVCLSALETCLQPQYANTNPSPEILASYIVAPQWQQFSSKAGGFSVLMPGTPTEDTDTKEFPVVGKGEVHLFAVQSELGVFVAAYLEITGLANHTHAFSPTFA